MPLDKITNSQNMFSIMSTCQHTNFPHYVLKYTINMLLLITHIHSNYSSFGLVIDGCIQVVSDTWQLTVPVSVFLLTYHTDWLIRQIKAATSVDNMWQIGIISVAFCAFRRTVCVLLHCGHDNPSCILIIFLHRLDRWAISKMDTYKESICSTSPVCKCCLASNGT